ncbi:MAG: hypothetical protein ACLFRU_10750, partial [Paracoccaceae bacterium]
MTRSARRGEFEIRDIYPTRQTGPERWIERQDPVLWSDWRPDAPLTREQAEAGLDVVVDAID